MYQKVKAYMNDHGRVVEGEVVLAGGCGGGVFLALLVMVI